MNDKINYERGEKMELIDIVNENNEFTGQIEEREIAYEKGLWRRTVSCWIMNEKVENAIFREVKEELGIEIPKNQIKIYDIHKSNDKTKRFSYNFIFKVNYKINEYTLQKEEVSDVKYVTIEEMELAREKNDSMYTFCFWDKEDFENEIKKLKQIRKEISKT